MVTLEGDTDGTGLRVCVVASRWNGFVVDRLLDGAVAALRQCNVADDDIAVLRVPGAFEVPTAAVWAARGGRYDAVVCLGAVIRGETAHFEYISDSAASGILRASLDTEVPVIFGVLTVDNAEQALARAGGKDGHKGEEAARVAVEMASLRRKLADQA